MIGMPVLTLNHDRYANFDTDKGKEPSRTCKSISTRERMKLYKVGTETKISKEDMRAIKT